MSANVKIGEHYYQVIRCYSYNRRLARPVQLYMTSLAGAVDTEMAKHDGYRNWDFNFRSEVYSAVFPRDRIVYLSAESEEVLEQLDPAAAYIIGGLVDHNHHKGLCHQRAVEAGVRTRAAND